MKIKEIEINNFRIYKEYNIIDLLPEKDKNIVIVSGKNGFGKTTFLMSLVWCLYGKQMPDVDTLYKEEINKQRKYSQYMGNSINRLAKAEGHNKFSVSITFVELNIPIEIPCKELKITRTYDTHTNDEKIEILINGVPNDLTNDYGYEKFIRDFILPIEIAKFFFFDAEKIVSLAEVHSKEQREQLSKAFSEVIGIKKYEDLKENINGLLLKLKNQSAKPEERLRLNELNSNINANQILITELRDKIKELTDENQSLQYDWNEAVEKLMSVGHTVSDEELEDMKSKMKELDEKKKRLQNELKSYYEIIPFGIAGEKLLEVVNQITQEAEYNKVKYDHENTENKTNSIVNDLYHDLQKEKEKYSKEYVFHADFELFLMKTIKKLIKKHVYNNDEIELPFGFDILHNFSNNEKSQLDDLVNHLKLSFREELKRMSSEQEQIGDELTRINRRISDAEKNLQNEIVAELRQKRLNLEKQIRENEKEIAKSDAEIERLTNDNKAKTIERNKLSEHIQVSDKNKDKEKLYKNLANELNNFIRKFQKQKQHSLEKRMLVAVQELMHMKLVDNIEVQIENDFVEVKLKNKRGEEISKESLSKGQQQIYASALLKSLVEESEINFPVFIDSPMQKFDETHSENIIRYFYPSVSEQVVIFPLINKELTFKEYQILKPKISKTYLINNVNSDKSEFQVVDINELIKNN